MAAPPPFGVRLDPPAPLAGINQQPAHSVFQDEGRAVQWINAALQLY